MVFSRQEYWSRLPFLLQGSSCPRDWTWVSCLQANSLPSELPGYPNFKYGIHECSHSSFCMWSFNFEETLVFLLYNLGPLVKDHLIMCVLVYFWDLCSIYLYAYLYGNVIMFWFSYHFYLFLRPHLFFKWIHFWLCWFFVAVQGLSLVVVSGGYFLFGCTHFSLQWEGACSSF